MEERAAVGCLTVLMSGNIGSYKRFDISRFVWYALELVDYILLGCSKARERVLLFVFCRVAILRRFLSFTHSAPPKIDRWRVHTRAARPRSYKALSEHQ